MTQTVKTIAAPTALPVTVNEQRSHMRILDDDGGHDEVIRKAIAAATAVFESKTGRAIYPRTLRLLLDRFPCKDGGKIYLPKPPAIQVISINYLDTNSQQQTLDEDAYQVDVDHVPARVAPAADTSWPETRSGLMGAVWIDFRAGYGTLVEGEGENPDTVTPATPDDVKAALQMLAAHFYENPEATTNLQLVAVPMGAAAIIEDYTMPNL